MREGPATEYRGPDGERLYLQLEVVEGDIYAPESMIYSLSKADRVVAIRLLFEQNGVKYVWRLYPDGTRLVEARQEEWPEPVEQYLVTRHAETIIFPTTAP